MRSLSLSRSLSLIRSLALVPLLALVAGCSGGGDGSPAAVPGGGNGPVGSVAPLRIWVTDAPFPFDYVESASVVIREVQVHDLDDDAWIVAYSGAAEIDLVPLQNGVRSLLVDVSPPPGTYDEVRLIVDAGKVVLGSNAVVQGGSHVFDTANGGLHFPSGAQTGIKVKIDNEIVVRTELSTDLVLDFDLERNFVLNGPVSHAPGVKRVIFTPVVRAVNASTTGTVALTVRSDNVTPDDTADDFDLEGATVRLRDGLGDLVATTSTGADGLASFSVAPGTYDIEIEASGHTSETLEDVVVVLANLNDLGAVLLEASGEIGGVLLSDGGTPGDDADDVVVAGATVELRETGAGGDPLATTTTDANGAWRFGGLEPGDYDIAVAPEGFVAGALDEIAAELATPGYTILLEAYAQDVAGTVTVAAGVDVTSIEIRAVNAAGTTVATTNPAEDGSYELNLATGAFDIEFDDGDVVVTEEVTLVGEDPQADATELNVTLE